MDTLRATALDFFLRYGFVEKNRIGVEDIKSAHSILKNAKLQLSTYWIGLIAGFIEMICIIFDKGRHTGMLIIITLLLTYLVGWGILGCYYIYKPILHFFSPLMALAVAIDLAFLFFLIAVAIYCPPLFIYVAKVQCLLNVEEANQYIKDHPNEEKRYVAAKDKKKK